ncbi:MAG: hypothetical protein ACO20I_15975 [bacterium]
MDLTFQELQDVLFAVRYYQVHNVSVRSDRYEEYSEILRKLDDHGKFLADQVD